MGTRPGASERRETYPLRHRRRRDALRRAVTPLLVLGLFAAQILPASANPRLGRRPRDPSQINPVEPPRVGPSGVRAAPELKGRTVEEVRILGNAQVPTAVIRNAIRTRAGEPYDPATVEEDYQRVYNLRKFANVEARVEPTPAGVNVVFVVTEQRQISAIIIRGNRSIDEATLRGVVELQPGEAIDPFRIALAKQAIQDLYVTRNYPLARVDVPQEPLGQRGELVFDVVEGPNVRVRNIEFKGNKSFTGERLRGVIKTSTWLFIFRPGRFDPDQVEEDVAALRRFYEGKGFFDARVGRKVVWSPDLTEVQINFLIEEGPQYKVDRVTFRFEGKQSLDEAVLRQNLRLSEGRAYDAELLQRDIRQVVRAYSPLGYIYQQPTPGAPQDPDYLQVDAKPVFQEQPGHVELVYTIREGKPFQVGRVIVKGNTRSQDKLVHRELRFAPGDLYNAAEVQDATDRLRGTAYFNAVRITPIGSDPNYRDVLVEVNEARTASFNVGAGVNSNGGIGGNITFEQRNFDIGDLPTDIRDVFSDRAFIGAGQTFRASFEPGTTVTNASLRFTEPWLFDQPYLFTAEGYLRDRVREDYDDQRLGGRVGLGHRFDYVHSALLSFRAEKVKIDNIDDPQFRAPEILAAEGRSNLTSVGLQFRRDTVNPGFLPYRGSLFTANAEFYGALGGDYDFQKYSLNYDKYFTLGEDLLDRKTVLGFHGNAGYITGDSVFFERFYGGGIGSVRGFRYRGISPRSGRAEDPVGGDFLLTGSAEVSFPLVGETIRGVTFFDAGTVERDVTLGTVRTSVGAGIRLVLPIFGQAPLAIDFAVPITKDDQDDTQFVSFSFGFIQ